MRLLAPLKSMLTNPQLVGAFFVIVKTDGLFAALVRAVNEQREYCEKFAKFR